MGSDTSKCSQELREKGFEVHSHEPAHEQQAGDARRLPFADVSFSLIYDKASLDTAHGELGVARLLREMRRVLKPGGTLLCLSRRSRDALLNGALPGVGMPGWTVSWEKKMAAVDESLLHDSQLALAKQLGALHQCVPAEGDEREGLKILCKIAMTPNAGADARCVCLSCFLPASMLPYVFLVHVVCIDLHFLRCMCALWACLSLGFLSFSITV